MHRRYAPGLHVLLTIITKQLLCNRRRMKILTTDGPALKNHISPMIDCRFGLVDLLVYIIHHVVLVTSEDVTPIMRSLLALS